NQENLKGNGSQEEIYYKIPRPGLLWDNEEDQEPLPKDGGRQRSNESKKAVSPPSEPVIKKEDQETEQSVIQYKLLERSDSKYNE
ncbi:MAG: hypothetical protein AB1801_28880, partial [Chloroflexota bacterium]